MADTVYTRTLQKAAAAAGSTQALATVLNVPESTLFRWMSGRAYMPLRAFLRLIEYLTSNESKPVAEYASAAPEDLVFRIGEHAARCSKCDSEDFRMEVPGPLRMTSRLLCRACGEAVIHGDLIARLASETIQHSRAMTVARARRQRDVLNRSPKLRALRNEQSEENTDWDKETD